MAQEPTTSNSSPAWTQAVLPDSRTLHQGELGPQATARGVALAHWSSFFLSFFFSSPIFVSLCFCLDGFVTALQAPGNDSRYSLQVKKHERL